MKAKYIIITGFVLLAVTVLVAFGAGMAQAQDQPPAPVPTGPGVPYLTEWEEGPHADAEAEAFIHWDEDDPKEIPTSCAKCHSTTGYLDYLGADGSEAGKVDKAQPTGQVVTCEACHNPAASALTEVTFPSGVTVTGLGSEARCMVCHSGNASMKSVNDRLEQFKASDVAAADKVPAKIKNADGTESGLSFINVHYRAAAATLYGGQAQVGYQYAGKSYDFKNSHVDMADTCIECHDPHTGEVVVETCQICHGEQVKSAADLPKIREFTSAKDYDGDGKTDEPILGEITGLQESLLKSIQAYAKEVAGAEIKYDANVYPYFSGVDGKAYPNWTPRLLKAAYNYQFSIKDTGQYAHGPKYVIQLLYDSIEDLNAAEGLKTKTDLTKMNRVDYGHFDGTSMAFRDWDADGEVPASCAKCHSATGLPQIFANPGATISTSTTNKALSSLAQPLSNGLACVTCHDENQEFPARYFSAAVKFPSGKDGWFAEADGNLCLNCHQGRQSKSTVDAAISRAGADKEVDKISVDKDNKPNLSFTNPHYFAAGATLLGTEVQGGYEYDEQKYSGRTMHAAVPPATTLDCTNCHNAHTLELDTAVCSTCHAGTKSIEEIRKPGDTIDYDGDGNTTEGFAGEIEGMQELLWTTIANYAKTTAKVAIVYDAHTNPYFFIDKNGNGKADPDELTSENRYYFPAKLLKAAYNYQWVSKDPGAFTHNFTYANQLLYDSIKDLGGDVTKLKRAEVVAGAVPEQPKAPETP